MNIVAPCPKKPSSLQDYHSTQRQQEDDAYNELRQILQSQSRHYCPIRLDDPIITRTTNPLPFDSSFIPLHQAVSHLQVSSSSNERHVNNRPRSLSVGNSRPMANLVH
ncbi:hypothetical protein BJ944DRAFT_243728 [Cunninghamella echinulata]|nr:hypothetical protein BJ944DRAFT_243728 [Cunninghamella echinulata]